MARKHVIEVETMYLEYMLDILEALNVDYKISAKGLKSIDTYYVEVWSIEFKTKKSIFEDACAIANEASLTYEIVR